MQNSSINRERIDKNGIQSSPLPDFLAEPIKKKDNHPDCPFRGPYRARTGDLHNAIVALSHAELTAPSCVKYTQGSKQSQSEIHCKGNEFSVSYH